MTSIHRLAVIVAGLLLSACSSIKLTPEGEQVHMMTMTEVTECKRVGKTAVSTLAKVVGLDRYQESMQDDLNKLSRNNAAELGGDSVVPISAIDDGRQVFAVYRCKPSKGN